MITARVLLIACFISRNFSWSASSSSRRQFNRWGRLDRTWTPLPLEAAAWLCFAGRFEALRKNGSPNYQDHRRPPAQSQEPHPGDSAGEIGRDHRDERFREILAGLRHPVCRGAAPLRGEPVGLRAAISRPDAEARRGFHRGPFAGDRHRAAQLVGEPAFDHRHDDGDLRLSAAALLVRRPAARSETGEPYLQVVAAADRGSNPGLSAGDPGHAARADRARGGGGVPRRAGKAQARGLCAGAGGWRNRGVERADAAGQAPAGAGARHRGGGGLGSIMRDGVRTRASPIRWIRR